jgi:hypothetical protein
MTFEQPELPLEFQTYPHYQIEIRKGQQHDEEVLREHKATSVEDAENLIEGLRDAYTGRDDVTWRDEEVDPQGKLYGLSPDGVVYVISVTPPLTVKLNP